MRSEYHLNEQVYSTTTALEMYGFDTRGVYFKLTSRNFQRAFDQEYLTWFVCWAGHSFSFLYFLRVFVPISARAHVCACVYVGVCSLLCQSCVFLVGFISRNLYLETYITSFISRNL